MKKIIEEIDELIERLEGWIPTAVSGVALVLSLVLMLNDIHWTFDPAWVAIIISGLPLCWEALTALIGERKITSELLVTIAMVACIVTDELFASAEVAFIMAIGELLEDYTVKRAHRGLSALMSIAPDTARLVEGTSDRLVSVDSLHIGDIVRVLPGERIAVDGEIVSGNTSVDQSVITGESLPIDKAAGDKVYCGTMNCFGSVDIRTTSVASDSSLQKMIRLVQDAETNKAPTQKIVDRWAEWLVPIALVLALIIGFATGDYVRGVTVLVVFCPCALALATPVSVVAGIGQATKFGVLIKSGDALERMGKVNCITFDKTGTLTKGALTVSRVEAFSSEYTKDDILRHTASVESRSEHPLAKAIVKAFSGNADEVSDFQIIPGKGVSGNVNGKAIMCGTQKWLDSLGVVFDGNIQSVLDDCRSKGMAVVLTSIDRQCVGLIALSDELRDETPQIVNQLHQHDVKVVVLTGDNEKAAHYIADKAGIRNVRAELLPEGKVNEIKNLQSESHNVCMVGDGINDAPALKTANVGVAMGGMGSDIAAESSDIILMHDNISQLPYLKRLSLAVIRSIKVNITISMAINFIAIILSALGVLGPISGALVHNVGSVLVVLNAALLYDRKI